jgi:hypothetical protein
MELDDDPSLSSLRLRLGVRVITSATEPETRQPGRGAAGAAAGPGRPHSGWWRPGRLSPNHASEPESESEPNRE